MDKEMKGRFFRELANATIFIFLLCVILGVFYMLGNVIKYFFFQ